MVLLAALAIGCFCLQPRGLPTGATAALAGVASLVAAAVTALRPRHPTPASPQQSEQAPRPPPRRQMQTPPTPRRLMRGRVAPDGTPSAPVSARKPSLVESMPPVGVGLVRSAVAQAGRRQLQRQASTDTETALAGCPNPNRPSAYAWLEPLLAAIAADRPPTVAGPAAAGGGFHASGTPLFVVAGACPSIFAGMQAVMYVALRSPAAAADAPSSDVDFWWIKPMGSDATKLEPATLNLHVAGRHKNEPGRSRAVYAPFAALFATPQLAAKLRFGLQPTPAGVRAYVRQGSQEPRYLVLVWQEAWTSNPFASKKSIRGKLLYQKGADSRDLFSCPYAIENEAVSVSFAHEEAVDAASVLPPDVWKVGFDVA